MEPLTEQVRSLLEKRAEAFPKFLAEIVPGIQNLAALVSGGDPVEQAADLEALLVQVETTLAEVDFKVLDTLHRVRVHTNLMFFIGELLVQRHRGIWFLQVDPESDFFLRYVVGGFRDRTDPNRIVDPAALAQQYITEPPGRSLVELLARLKLGPAASESEDPDHG